LSISVSKDLPSVRSLLCEEIAAPFQEADLARPSPQRDLHLRSAGQGLLERALDLQKKQELAD